MSNDARQDKVSVLLRTHHTSKFRLGFGHDNFAVMTSLCMDFDETSSLKAG